MNELVFHALSITGETQRVDFKRQFDPGSAAEWCELIKDIVAMANAGGGVLLIGLEDDGTPSAIPPQAAFSCDPALIDDKIYRYTNQHLEDVELCCAEKDGHEVLAIAVAAARIPVVFTNPGTYAVAGGKQQTAFGRGTVYYRHGAKSEVGTTEDLRSTFERELSSRREEWLGNIRRVVEAPPGALVHVVPAEFGPGTATQPTVGVRLVYDSKAPEVPQWNPDDTHPYRLKELLSLINAKLGILPTINTFDIQCVRRVHDIDVSPNFYYRSRHGSPQYSAAFLEWMADQFASDKEFFHSARAHVKGGSSTLPPSRLHVAATDLINLSRRAENHRA